MLDPDKRVSASMALELPMFADFREPEEETEALPYDHSMDNADLPLEQWKRKNVLGDKNAESIINTRKWGIRKIVKCICKFDVERSEPEEKSKE